MKPYIRYACYAACIALTAFMAHSDLKAAPPTVGDLSSPPTNNVVWEAYMEAPSPTKGEWQNNFEMQFDKRFPIAAFDSAASAQAKLRMTREMDHMGYAFNTSFARNIEGSYQHSFIAVLRETTISSVPLISDSRSMIGTFLFGSLAHTSERSIRPTGITPAGAQMEYWDDLLARHGITYGSRIYDGDYFYADGHIGHWSSGGSDRPILGLLVRFDGDPLKLQTKWDDQVSIFLPWSTALIFGSSYELTSIRNDERKLDYSVGLSHSFGKHWYDGVISLAYSSDTKSGKQNIIACLYVPL